MATFRKAVLAVIVKSLMRGKSLIQAILAYWISPLALSEVKGLPPVPLTPNKTIEEFLKQAEVAFLNAINSDDLVRLSAGLKKQYLDKLQNDVECMLPSYSHQLPFGDEAGRYLALDVGGSTLRVALVELSGLDADGKNHSRIISIRNFSIDKPIKDLEGVAFFDWMASKIIETVSTDEQSAHGTDEPLSVALAWSFPIEQTSLGGGKLQGMGKGFMANKGLIGQDLGELIQNACQKQGLNVAVEAILNDSSACLLSQAYSHTSTRFGLILGTGFNVGAYLPISLIGRQKFGVRPAGWFDRASHVIVNTELSMFGHGLLPVTRWDQQLLDNHPRPEFQPLEYMASGMYLGEIARYALIEAIETTGLFGGVVPPSLNTPYGLATYTLSMLEADTTSDLAASKALFAKQHPSTYKPTTVDLAALRKLASYISMRSSALIAASLYALWDVRIDSHKAVVAGLPESSHLRQGAEADLDLKKTMVAFNGSVIENYPGYLASCQRFVDELVENTGRAENGSIELVAAKESSLLGAAVASACAKRN